MGYALYPNSHPDKMNMIFMDVFSIFKSITVHVVDFWRDYIFLLLFLTFSFPLVTALFFNWHLPSIRKKYLWNDSKIFWTIFFLYTYSKLLVPILSYFSPPILNIQNCYYGPLCYYLNGKRWNLVSEWNNLCSHLRSFLKKLLKMLPLP